MATVTIDELDDLGALVATGDYLPVWDVSAGATKKVSRANLIGGQLTDGGTVATGGFTLTVPATGTAVLRETLNTFDRKITSAVGAGTVALDATGGDLGTNGGRAIVLGRNNNGSTPGAGNLRLAQQNGTVRFIWPDASGNLRIHNAEPTNANDTAGTVVGTQTSSLDSKEVLDGLSNLSDVLAAVQAGAEAVRRFRYRAGGGFDEDGNAVADALPYNGEAFEGVIVDYAPRYGMDRDPEHPAGKSLNLINVVGDLLRAVAWLVEREVARGD